MSPTDLSSPPLSRTRNNTSHRPPTVATARVVAGSRRRGGNGLGQERRRRPIFGHRSLIQQHALASVKGSSPSPKKKPASSPTSNVGAIASPKDAGSHDGTSSPKSVMDIENFTEAMSNETSTAASEKDPSPSADTSTRNGCCPDTEVLPPLRLPRYSTKMHECLTLEVSRRKLYLFLYNTQIIAGAAAAIITAVLYAHLYGDTSESAFPSWNNVPAVLLFASTVVLPLYVAYLIPRRSRFQKAYPMLAAQVAVAKWEAEMYKFRVQTCSHYDTTLANGTDKSLQPRTEEMQQRVAVKQALQEEGQTIWNSILPMVVDQHNPLDMEDEKCDLSDDFDFSSNSQNDGARNLAVTIPPYKPPAKWEEELPCAVIPETSSAQNDEANNIHLPSVNDLETPTETTPMLLKSKANMGSLSDKRDSNQDVPLDPYSLWTLDEYVERRLATVVESKKEGIDTLEWYHTKLKRLIAMLTAGASLTALLAQQWLIPIILALAAAGNSTLETSSLTHRIDAQRKALQQLQQLLNEHQDSLDVESGSQNILVQEVEKILIDSLV